MGLACVSLALTPAWHKDQIVVFGVTDALRLCGAGGFERIPRGRAVAHLESLDRQRLAAGRDFVTRSRLTNLPLARLSDRQVLDVLRRCLWNGDLVVLRASGESHAESRGPKLSHRRLVRQVEAKISRRLKVAGRQYTLVADSDLPGMSNRDGYEVVKRSEAVQILEVLAKQHGARVPGVAELLDLAGARIAHDWKPPLQPDGLILLRKISGPVAVAKPQEPALTPSQLKSLIPQKTLNKTQDASVTMVPISAGKNLVIEEPKVGDLEVEFIPLPGGAGPSGRVALSAEDGSWAQISALDKAERRENLYFVRFKKVTAHQKYTLDIETTGGVVYRVLTSPALNNADLILDGSPGHPLVARAVRVVYVDAPDKPVSERSIAVQLEAWHGFATSARGALIATLPSNAKGKTKSPKGRRPGLVSMRVSKRPTPAPPPEPGEPIWLDPSATQITVALLEDLATSADPPPEQHQQPGTIVPLMDHATGLTSPCLQVMRINLVLPIAVKFADLPTARGFLGRHPMRVDVDGFSADCQVHVASTTLWHVEFPVSPGEHKILVTAQETQPEGPIQPRRTIFFARKVTVAFPGRGGPALSLAGLSTVGLDPADKLVTPAAGGKFEAAVATATSSPGPAGLTKVDVQVNKKLPTTVGGKAKP